MTPRNNKAACLAMRPLGMIAICVLLASLLGVNASSDPMDVEEDAANRVEIVLHRNGEISPCATSTIAAKSVLDPIWKRIDDEKDKFHVESQLTQLVTDALDEERLLMPDSSQRTPFCASTDNTTAIPLGLPGYCDMGPSRTVLLLDHKKLQRLPFTKTLPCRWFTREGLRITSFQQLHDMVEKQQTYAVTPQQSCPSTSSAAADGSCASNHENGNANGDGGTATQVHLYAVPAGRVFMFAPSYIGETFVLDHLTMPNAMTEEANVHITLEVMSLSPRVFDIKNFFSVQESIHLVDRALKETSPTHKIKRSTTGTGEKNVIQTRTSESGFDTHGAMAMAIKRRIVEALGMDEYWPGHDDGLQILRYNKTTAYTPHMDYMTDTNKISPYNYESDKKGGNRFATVLLYMNDMVDDNAGGELVFPKTDPPSNGTNKIPAMSMSAALRELRATGHADEAGIKRDSWEEKMVATCRSKFSIKPKQGRAVLFYSQHPNGEQDYKSRHGGCPVLKGEKWAANLWVWNAPRGDFPGQPLREDDQAKELLKKQRTQSPESVAVTFRNTRKDPRFKQADLYYDEAQHWGKLGFNDPPLRANSFEGHRWNVRVDGKILKRFVIGSDEHQIFTV
mmetsp:Transcript_22553/g.63889  ORF Transcript_22553/g.63889 Transcript_22553/m.63889 type:complete len:622 (+) Transcript_22553:230-2095(+)|eukprot:CAMPEP_0119558610 /NCGR_PEP_ID=MMETSP1352-20130426/10894_1 /TAXON_ID=265584 /ORGANISM="Stauroneis constricta, Strain CCMP1120" /LENGTH=621 /DNA_ID=CAMNT_0007606015 /DNA_START=169 /DNA_END=2034 /DNA_ORIENTATION=+